VIVEVAGHRIIAIFFFGHSVLLHADFNFMIPLSHFTFHGPQAQTSIPTHHTIITTIILVLSFCTTIVSTAHDCCHLADHLH